MTDAIPEWQRQGRDGPFDWYLNCQHHGVDYQAGCFSCGFASRHNDRIEAEIAAATTPPAPAAGSDSERSDK